ncbi:UDP-glucose 4-epimerase GalE [Comamonas sp. Y6]|uniref:UDP-glucose 4-epimerase n=1 Tax=Comamonas resistens TaxID=3046670 RepID=A0ABY8SR09_9BURK|nr:UDP-glucose 4-epimerase GalE [Comamonas resistens]MDL5036583.1 UDP-glucose 4-epimerase GalE [Comamonas resistens]WHS64921.1 UDP-glucose 4-epimerase GalE [Comamonas resistens]
MKTLLTGGAGYIGSHTAIELISHGHEVVIFDNFSNSHPEAVRRVEQIAGRSIPVIQADVRDQQALESALGQHGIDSVVHFAGKKAVGESVAQPVDYYDNNVNGTLVLLRAMKNHNVRKLVFSSSATVYGSPQYLPLDEKHATSVTNPYGRSKLMVEEILADLYHSDPQWSLAVLRYFNPIGAHESGLIGEDPSDIPNNLLPYIAQVAVGRRQQLQIFGGDYDTVDGTGVRDYIHVVDLARGHVKALEKLAGLSQPELLTVNLGTGNGYSVLEVLQAFEKACGKTLPYAITDRRPGDVASCYANPAHALATLGWQAQHNLDEMCADTWRWQSQNPNGYRSA